MDRCRQKRSPRVLPPLSATIATNFVPTLESKNHLYLKGTYALLRRKNPPSPRGIFAGRNKSLAGQFAGSSKSPMTPITLDAALPPATNRCLKFASNSHWLKMPRRLLEQNSRVFAGAGCGAVAGGVGRSENSPWEPRRAPSSVLK